jgi:hypothetical protein
MSCCSVAFCGFVVKGSVYLVLGCCRLFGLGFISFFIRKLVAVLPVVCCGSSGKRGNALAALGFSIGGFWVGESFPQKRESQNPCFEGERFKIF